MTTDKKYFFLKLNPPRPTFAFDMNEDEKQVMQSHMGYWAPYVENGTVVVIGPVLDPNGPFGAAVVRVDNEEEVNTLITNDPANQLSSYEVHPMMAVTKS
ncbi:YciI family protein [Sabulibacter ruber]|uniref:YciI family protein n=1 Tax=Sabulibacter ruber TaxID=2811901 RepID=UPI001A961671|nr:YciI family protein [Sabulibacter ruber]